MVKVATSIENPMTFIFKELPLYAGVLVGFVLGLLMTVTFVLEFKKAMPALLFILPMEVAGIFIAAWVKYGR